MPGIETLIVFTAAAIVMNLSPGPSNVYVMSRSIAQGPAAGAMAALGLALGSLVHVVATALGIAALLAVSPLAYTALKVAGAAYLVWLGVGYWMSADTPAAPRGSPSRMAHVAILRQSALVEITNPKTALFFVAFLPQFVDLSRGPPVPQLLLLGAIVTLTAIPCDLLVAQISGRAGRWLRDNHTVRRLQTRVSGSIVIGLGAWVALDTGTDR